jgi:hypothetical protein
VAVGLDGTWGAPEVRGLLMGILYRGRPMSQLLLAGLLALLLVGCGEDSGAGGGGGEPPTLKGPITYERGGGIAGRRDRLIVEPDGSASLTVRDGTRAIKLSAAELTALADELKQTDLASIPAKSISSPPVADAFAYRVEYDGKRVDTDSEAMPDELRGVTAELGGLVDRHSAR